jgi:putative ABC transport system permease protein
MAAAGGAGGRSTRGWSWRGVPWGRVSITALVVAGLVGVASWQAGSWRVGAIVSAGFVVVVMALNVAATSLVWAVRPLANVRWFPLRHAVVSVGRPGNQTRVILLAVGLGAFFIVGIRAVQGNLLREFSIDLRPGGPDMFLIDIQPDQVSGVRDLVRVRAPWADTRFIPVLRARVTGVKGGTTRLDSFEDVRGQGSLAREYVITYRAGLEANESVVAGRLWPPAPSSRPEVSIEESIRERFRIDVGDRVRFDVLGRVVEATVTSVRRVEWSDARAGGFIFVFRPGVLEAAPSTHIGILRAPSDPGARARFQRDLVARYPNVSAIDVREITRTVQGVLGNITLAITVVGAVALLSGVLILVGSVAMTKFQRLHEAAVFKTLGASTRRIATMLALEYATLGALAGLVGTLAAVGSSWAICRLLLDIPWRAAPDLSAAAVGLTTVLVGVVGVASSLDVLRRKPLATLRAE